MTLQVTTRPSAPIFPHNVLNNTISHGIEGVVLASAARRRCCGEQGGRDRGRLGERVIYGDTGIPRIWLPPLCGEEGGGGGGFGSEDIGLLVKGKPFVGNFRPLVSVTGACKE